VSASSDKVGVFAHEPCRFVDRDMVMRYYYGLGVGHMYTHVQSPGEPPSINQCGVGDMEQPEEEKNTPCGSGVDFQEPTESFLGTMTEDDSKSDCSYSSDLDDEWEDEGGSLLGPSDDEEFYEMEMMYGSNEN
jgi:hypothetical protein